MENDWYGINPDGPADLRTEETPFAELVAIAGEVEAGVISLPPHWIFERTAHGTQIWGIPSGRTFECDNKGRLVRELPLR